MVRSTAKSATKRASATNKAGARKAPTKTSGGRTPTPETQVLGEQTADDGNPSTGLIARMGLIDAPVQFAARDGLAILEGDMILGTVEDLDRRA